MADQKITINNFSAGIQTSDRGSVLGGATMIKNFDIYEDARKLRPLPTWESWATAGEEAYGITVLGASTKNSETILGVGKALDNWLDSQWLYRVQVQASGTPAVSQLDYGWFELSNMPAAFWTHVASDGDDIRVTDANHQPVPYKLYQWNYGGNTGSIVFLADDITQPFYVYYGKASASAPTYLTANVFNNQDSVWVFHENFTDYVGGFNTDGVTFTAGTGRVVDGMTTGSVRTSTGAGGGYMGAEATVSFIYYFTAAPGVTDHIVNTSDSAIEIKLRTDRKIDFIVNTTVGNDTLTSTTALSTSTYYYIACSYDTGTDTMYIYLNGSLDASKSHGSGGDIDSSGGADILVETPGTGGTIELLTRRAGSNASGDLSNAMGSMIASNNTFWTYGSEVAYSSITPSYSGTQIYTKALSASTWSSHLINQSPVKTFDYYPMASFIFSSSSTIYTVVNSNSGLTGTRYLTKLNSTALNWTFGNMGSGAITNMPRVSYGVDKAYYMTEDSALVQKMTGGTFTSDVFTGYGSSLTNLNKYGQYEAVASYSDAMGYCQLWDLDSTTATAFIEMGFGKLMCTGNITGTLFGIVNQNLDENNLVSGANGRRAMNIVSWNGGDYAEPFVSLETHSSLASYYTNAWEGPVMNLSESIKNGFVFYARILDEDAAVQEGLWAVGKSEQGGNFGLSLRHTAPNDEDITHFFRTGDVLLCTHNRDGSVSKISDDSYTATSSWESIFFDGGDKENIKSLKSVEFTCEPLASGQTITVYYRKEGESNWTQIATEDTDNEVRRVARVIESTSRNLPSFKEIQFKLESTGGKSAITSFAFTYEDSIKR